MSRTPMKLILTQEVSGLGAPGDVVDVAAHRGEVDLGLADRDAEPRGAPAGFRGFRGGKQRLLVAQRIGPFASGWRLRELPFSGHPLPPDGR